MNLKMTLPSIWKNILSMLGAAGFFFLVTPMYASPATQQPLRVKYTLDTNWRYTQGNPSGADAALFNDDAWTAVHVPHNFQKMSVTGAGNYYRGYGFYRKHFPLNANLQGRQITVYFEGAMTVTDVWINGNKLATHSSGFTPFSYDITQYCTFGAQENVLAVRVNNSYQKQVPPEKPDGSSIDFEMFGGIYRDVWIIATDKIFVPDPVHDWANKWTNQGGHFITFSNVSSASATLTVRTWVKNSSAGNAQCKLVTAIVNASNQSVQSNESAEQAVAANSVTRFAQTIAVANPTLWFPWAPYLYSVVTIIYKGTVPVDVYTTKIGIRQLQFNKTSGATCNGVYFKMLGLNRHQTWPFVGHAVPNIQQRRDAELLKDAGCNLVRCSHYLQDDAFMDACDSLGIFLWLETPGWHCCNNDGKPEADEAWRARHLDEVRFMVRTARNHPSVAIWAPAINEAVSDPTIENPMNDLCHAEDSTRPTSAGRAGWQHPTGAGKNIYDLYGDNQFTPGSIPTSNPDPNTIGYVNTEHTGHTYDGFSSRDTNSESDLLSHAWKHAQMTAEARDRGKWVTGGMGWCMFDYYTGGSIRAHGVMDLMHIPKFAFWFYKSQSASDNYDGSIHPFLKIANWYTAASPLNRDVYHNCEQVKLYRNGTLVATQGPATTLNLAHGVTTFKDIAFETGMLIAEGLIGGAIVARDTARTPGAVASIRLEADPPAIEANGGDFSRIVATLIDNMGTYVPNTNNKVTFTLSGQGALVGDNPIKAQSGACIILAKAALASGTMTVSATAGTLTSNSVVVTIKPMASSTPVFLSNKPMVTETAMPRICKMMGNCRVLPTMPFKKASVVVFDLNGRLVYRGVMHGRKLDLREAGVSADRVYLLKAGE